MLFIVKRTILVFVNLCFFKYSKIKMLNSHNFENIVFYILVKSFIIKVHTSLDPIYYLFRNNTFG